MTDLSVAVAPEQRNDSGDDSASAAPTEAIVIRLGSGKFAVDLAAVAEVGRIPDITRVPGLPTWLAGVANWRGRILPILDLRTLLGADAGPHGSRSRLLVVADATLAVGLLVDAVDGTTILDSEVAAFPPALSANAAGLLCGQLPRDDGPVAVIDVPAVLRLRDGLPRGRRSA